MDTDPVFTVTGTVTATPAYPGPQRIDSPVPASRPVAGATVRLTSRGTPVASTTTDATGRFAVMVPAGRYDVTATGTGYRGGATRELTVAGPTAITLVVDSGMR